jgi:Protein of unknown function (DUF2795)
VTGDDVVEVTQRLRDVLAEQQFPAARWELIACAQNYGADVHTLRELHALPEAIFRCLTDVERVVADANSAALRHGRADVPRGPAQQ